MTTYNDLRLQHVGVTWHSEHCREKYHECIKQIEALRAAYQLQADPWIKLAGDYRSMGSSPFVVVVPGFTLTEGDGHE